MRRINLKKANVARADTIRYINRQIVLNFIRERQPISRAEISHETALQRSIRGLWVEEGSPIPNARGLRNDVVAALKQLHG